MRMLPRHLHRGSRVVSGEGTDPPTTKQMKIGKVVGSQRGGGENDNDEENLADPQTTDQ
jgi:hypothetical protein